MTSKKAWNMITKIKFHFNYFLLFCSFFLPFAEYTFPLFLRRCLLIFVFHYMHKKGSSNSSVSLNERRWVEGGELRGDSICVTIFVWFILHFPSSSAVLRVHVEENQLNFPNRQSSTSLTMKIIIKQDIVVIVILVNYWELFFFFRFFFQFLRQTIIFNVFYHESNISDRILSNWEF